MLSDILSQTLLLPLAYLSHYPGVTLLIALLTLCFTLKSRFKKYRGKAILWLCVVINMLYGLYDIYVYCYYPTANIRFDLLVFGPIFYFSLLYWFIIYKQRNL